MIASGAYDPLLHEFMLAVQESFYQ